MNKTKVKDKNIALIFPKHSSAIFDDKSIETFGGATVQMFLLAKEFNNYDDVEVSSLVVDLGQKKEDIINGLKLYKTFSKKDNLLLKIIKFHKAIQKVKPDVIIQRGLTIFSCLLAVYCKIFKIKFVYMFASDVEVDGYYQTGHKKARVLKLLINYADILVTQNQYQYDKILNKYSRKTNKIYSGFPIENSYSNNREFVLWVGRAEKLKRPDKFIKLSSLNCNYKFVIVCNKAVGQEDYFSNIQQLAEDVGNLEFLQHVPFGKIDTYFKKAKIFVNTSDYEGFPQTFIQAMKNKTPIVSLNVNPDNFLTEYNCGFCCNNNFDEMNKKLNLLLEDKELYREMSENVYKYAKENHDIKKNAKKFYELIIKKEDRKMCGIVGFNWKDEILIKKLVNLLTHRGPDDLGYYTDDNISLGHRRLSIIDLSKKGKQPMFNEDGNFIIVYNGETYNFKELRKKLIEKKYKFISNTDTEVILHGYEEWGKNVLNMLNGQFAFCIYDKTKKELFLARDRLGIKPLYYYNKDGKFIFGSELKVILKSNINKEIDKDALNHYLIFGYTPSEKSILRGVFKLLPAHYLIYDLKNKKIKEYEKYWENDFKETKITNETEIKKLISTKLDKSVKQRLIADVPVGAFLSGGVDSSIIVALMRKYIKDLKTFSIRFDYDEFNESEYAKIISEKFNTDHYEIEFNAKNVKELISELAFFYDEPFGDPSMIPTYLVSKVAKEHVTVCLSGTGGDELFAGYPRYKEFMTLKKLNKLPDFLKKISTGLYSLFDTDKSKKLKQLFKENKSDYVLYLKLLSYLFRDEKELDIDMDKLSTLKKHFKYQDDLKNLLSFDQNEYLLNDMLVKEDRAALGVSLEGRVPFLDHEFVEFVNGIDSGLKLKKNETKYILKETFEGILHKEILYRKKQGFGVPLKHYFRKELRSFAYKEIFEFDDFNYYNKKTLKELWEKHQNKESDYSHLFWTIIMFNLWYKKWILEKEIYTLSEVK